MMGKQGVAMALPLGGAHNPSISYLLRTLCFFRALLVVFLYLF